jgi:hypothetical protein
MEAFEGSGSSATVGAMHLVVGGHEVVVTALDGHIAVRPARVLAPLAHVACRAIQCSSVSTSSICFLGSNTIWTLAQQRLTLTSEVYA